MTAFEMLQLCFNVMLQLVYERSQRGFIILLISAYHLALHSRVSRFFTFFSQTLSLYDLRGANCHKNPLQKFFFKY